MKQEPVAWGFFDKDGVIYDCVTNRDYCGENGKPLYTHPSKHDLGIAEAIGFDKGHEAGRQLGMRQERALWELSASTQEIENPHPAKTLTDEEIDDIGREHLTDGDGAIEFARAILKKASEK
jgi:hypothetical protein